MSGTEVVIATDRSRAVLRALIEAHVVRALEEQKANAKGIPPLPVQSVRSRQPAAFARHEFMNGLWRKITTNDVRQPIYGFTIAAEHPSNEVEMLRAAYTAADDPTRNVIRKLAELSVTNDEPPMRRYTP